MTLQNDVVPPSSQTDSRPTPTAQFVTITEEEAGQRIDNYLLRVCKGVPKSHIYRILRSGEVRVNKGRIDQLYRLAAGDVVRIPPVRIAERQAGAGAQALLLRLCKLGGIDLQSLQRGVIARTGDDLALAVREGRVDCGIATRATAATRGLDFVSLAWERFDLVIRRRNFFEPSVQALIAFARHPAFKERAEALSGYDVSETGQVMLNR
jgi:molybdate-binding protein